jgi:hypothetical protein
MGVVSRPIVTHPSNPAYDAGWVFTFRKCPECKCELSITKETDTSFHFNCTGCAVEGNVDMSGQNG